MTARDVICKLDEIAREYDGYEYGLPVHAEEVCKLMDAVVEAAILEEREACVQDVQSALSDVGTDDPHEALRLAIKAIRKRQS
jgi:hypothetical protein